MSGGVCVCVACACMCVCDTHSKLGWSLEGLSLLCPALISLFSLPDSHCPHQVCPRVQGWGDRKACWVGAGRVVCHVLIFFLLLSTPLLESDDRSSDFSLDTSRDGVLPT